MCERCTVIDHRYRSICLREMRLVFARRRADYTSQVPLIGIRSGVYRASKIYEAGHSYTATDMKV